MDFAWTDDQNAFRDKLRVFLAERLPDDWEEFSKHGPASPALTEFAKTFCAQLAEAGMLFPHWPVEAGGQGLGPWHQQILAEVMWEAGEPRGGQYMNVNWIGPTLMKYGTEAQKERYLKPITEGKLLWCQGFSEPNSGSDLASLRTRAVREGDTYRINGQKIWTSFGAVSDYCYLICRTRKEGPPHAGISEIIVPMNTPGIEVREIKDLTTNRHFCEVFFTDVRVPVSNLVGVEGAAFKQTMAQLEHERGGIDRVVSNYALYLAARARADTTDPLVRQEIARLEIGYRIGRILVTREVLKQAPAGFSAATKCFGTEHEQRVADFVWRTLGPDGTLWDDTTKGLCYNPGYTIMGGTSNVMRNIIGERVLGLPR